MRLQFKGGSSEGCHFPSLERMTWSGVYQDIFASWPKLLPDWGLTLSIPACGNFHNLIVPASRPVLLSPLSNFPTQNGVFAKTIHFFNNYSSDTFKVCKILKNSSLSAALYNKTFLRYGSSKIDHFIRKKRYFYFLQFPG